MTAPVRPPAENVAAQPLRPPRVSDDLAYVLPMLPFLWVILPLEEMLVHAAQLIMR